MEEFRFILQHELSKRIARNSKYSLRSFSKFLKVSPTTLSGILSGKRGISIGNGEKIAEQLSLNCYDKSRFMESIKELKGLRGPEEECFQLLHKEQLQVIREWYHAAILNIVKLKQFKNDYKWIAKKLGISTWEVKTALSRLIKLDLLEAKESLFKRTKKSLMTTDNIPSGDLKYFHKQILNKVITSLDEVSLEQRDVSTMVFTIDSKDIPEIKNEIRDFRRKLIKKYEKDDADNVYALNVSVVPLTKE